MVPSIVKDPEAFNVYVFFLTAMVANSLPKELFKAMKSYLSI